MTFVDTYDGRVFSLLDIFNDWKVFKEEDPENHADTFRAEMLEIIMATINGRNDLEIKGLTASETERLVYSLRH